MHEAHKGIQAGENHPMYGKHHTEETKQKISEAKKGKSSNRKGCHHTEETKQKISESLNGKILSEETKEKLRQATKKWWETKKHKS